ncbi:MAG: GDP-mannose 4,6-dehydratase, partial [Chloroflexales bacterium]|nr:GDP-mannose 4,6-dehydratase [Chloroflexales bacterium]
YSAYGPYEDPQRLIPRLIVRGLTGELPPLVDPAVTRDLVYVEDVCDAFLLAASCTNQEPGAVYNVGSGVQTTIGEAVALARRELAIAAEPVWNTLPGRSWDARTWVADNRKIRQQLGWQPRHSFEQGFRLTRDWLCAHPALLARYQASS